MKRDDLFIFFLFGFLLGGVTMPRGMPDYNNPSTQVSAVQFDPSAIMTAMQGINSVDGLGRIWKIDNFNHGLGSWGIDAGGNGVAPYAYTGLAEIGLNSLRMNAGTLAGDGESAIAGYLHINTDARVGFEFGVWYSSITPNYIVGLSYFLTGDSFSGSVILNSSDRKVYVDNNGVNTLVYTLPSGSIGGVWLPLKVVVDFSTNKYVRLMIGQRKIDLSQYSLPSNLTSGIGDLYLRLGAFAYDGTVRYGYVGHSIITLDEP